MMKANFLILLIVAFAVRAHAQPVISFTFDDGATNDMPGYPFKEWNQMLLHHLEEAHVKAILFSTGYNKLDDKGQFLLKSWSDKGHKIGNHTFSHLNYNSDKVTFEKFSAEFLSNDTIINKFENYIRLFRFPYLKEGNTKEKVVDFRELMKAHHYKNGHVTIDASDWYIDSRLRERLRGKPNANLDGFKKYYLDHLYARALYYESLAFDLKGRHINHTLLLHHNLASALFLGDLIKMFKDKGWKIMDANDAYDDEIFETSPSHVPAGESLIWALAKESGKFEATLRYPAEDSEYEKAAMDKLGL